MIAGTFRTVAGLNRDLRTLFLSTLLFRAGTMAFPFLAAYLLEQQRYSASQVGLVVGAFGAGALLADLSASVFLGRIPPAKVMLAGSLVYAAVISATPLLSGVLPLTLATLVWGAAYESYTPAVYSQVVASSEPHERKIAFSCNRLAINLGMGVGPAVGGLLFTVAPTALFYVNAACVLGAAALLRSRAPAAAAPVPREAPVPGEAPASREKPLPRGEREPYRSAAPGEGGARFWTIFGLAIPVHVVYALPPVLLSAYVIEGLGLPAYWASLVFVVNASAIVLFEVPLNKAMADVPDARSLLVGFCLAGLGFALMGVTASGILLAAITLVWTTGEMIIFPSLISYVSRLSDRSVVNRNVSLYAAGVNIGFVAAPQVGRLLASESEPGTPWLVTGLTVLAAFLLMIGAQSSPRTWYPEARKDLAVPAD